MVFKGNNNNLFNLMGSDLHEKIKGVITVYKIQA